MLRRDDDRDEDDVNLDGRGGGEEERCDAGEAARGDGNMGGVGNEEDDVDREKSMKKKRKLHGKGGMHGEVSIAMLGDEAED
jgi:hypothetical protein